MRGAAIKPTRSLWLFLTFGLLAQISAFRSFWPLLSVTQGCLFCLVLLLAEFIRSTFSPASILRATYYGIVSVFALAIALGIVFPETYPLAVIDEFGRHRIALFTYINGDFSYMTGLAFFVGRLRPVQARWYSQMFLVLLTVASGSRVSASALVAIWLISQLFRGIDFRLRVAKLASAAGVGVLVLILVANGYSGVDTGARRMLAGMYGSGTLEQPLSALDGRVELWTDAFGLFRDSAVVGFGFSGARDELIRMVPWSGQVHNGFLDLLLSGGGAGLLCFVAGWVFVIRSGLRTALGRSTLAIHCFLLVVAMTGPSFTMNMNFAVFLILCVYNWTRTLEAPLAVAAGNVAPKFGY